jgi:predicted metalloendopeptidase
MIEQHNDEQLHQIVQDPSTGKVNTFWSACMNTSQIASFGTAGLNQLLALLTPIKDVNTLMYAIGQLQLNGVSALFAWGVDIDAKNPSINIAQIGQGVCARR